MDKKVEKILNEEFSSKEDLIKHLKNNTQVLKNSKIEKAFEKIDRKDFVSEDYKCEAYEDYPIPIGYGQTISQPTTVIFMLELLNPKSGDKILDIGSGSGWVTALLAEMVGEKGSVEGKEIVPELAEFGKKNLAKYNFKNVKISKTEKLKEEYDKILVSAAFKKEILRELINHLKIGGTIVAPVDSSICKLTKNKDGKINQSCYEGFTFVPYIYEK